MVRISSRQTATTCPALLHSERRAGQIARPERNELLRPSKPVTSIGRVRWSLHDAAPALDSAVALPYCPLPAGTPVPDEQLGALVK